MSNTIDIEHFRTWIGRTKQDRDVVTPRLAASLLAVYDRPVAAKEGDIAPPGVHWALSPDIAPMSGLGTDGHPERGGFLPPIPFPRRMWAGSTLHLSGDIRVGDVVTRTSTISDVTLKSGESGALCFLKMWHMFSTPRGVAISEEQNLVYKPLDDAAPKAPSPPPPVDQRTADFTVQVNASATLLARYSAVTFNGHRIHYDRPYAISEEHYPGLVVHGPLQASLLLVHTVERKGWPATFSFRAMRPLFDNQPFTLNGAEVDGNIDLWVKSSTNETTMQGAALFKAN